MIDPVADMQKRESNTSSNFDFMNEILPLLKKKATQATEAVGNFSQEVKDFASPLKGKFNITQAFGNYNPSLYQGITKGSRHLGVDLATPQGTDVYAPETGNVTYGKDKYSGNYADMTLPDGSTIRFSHLSQTGANQTVKAGQAIAKTGSTGNSTGAHLDVSVRKNGQFIDPMTLAWLKNYLMGGENNG